MTPEELGLVLCKGCGKYVDPDICGCGDWIKNHQNAIDAGHPPIPAGCDCYRNTGKV